MVTEAFSKENIGFGEVTMEKTVTIGKVKWKRGRGVGGGLEGFKHFICFVEALEESETAFMSTK